MDKEISKNEFDKYIERFNQKSTLSKVQQQFWEVKQTFLQKISKKEDDCVISYDLELDVKLELFKSIVETSQRLLYIIEAYQDQICLLSHEESCTGQFLKKCGRTNNNLIDKMLTVTGKTLCYIAQQRIQIGELLIHIYHYLETFQYKAISDTLCTIEKMEKEKTAYRASLLWIKSLSNKLDPDLYLELEKFRKVQNHVRKTKEKYDKKKIDCIQKIDMLNASRCNLLNQTLTKYQTAWLNFWKNTNLTLESISTCFQDCQHYEFTVLKDLKMCYAKEVVNDEEENFQFNSQKHEDFLLIDIEDKKNNNLHLEENYKKKENELNKKIDLIDNDDKVLFDLEIFNNKKDKSKNNCSKLFKNYKENKNKEEIDLLTPRTFENQDNLMLDIFSTDNKNLSDSIFNQTLIELDKNQNFKAKSKNEDKKEIKTKLNFEYLKLFSELDPLSKKLFEKSSDSC